jgi:hypothetical protein
VKVNIHLLNCIALPFIEKGYQQSIFGENIYIARQRVFV